MAIQLRRGNYVDYDPTKMKDGEVAVVKAGDPATNDGKSAYIEISGDSKRIILEDDPTSDNTVNFTTGDAADPSAWTDVAIVASGETHASLFNKITTMIKNTRWIKKFLGTTSISSIGNGTVTGALSKLNTDSYQYKGVLTSSDNLNNVTTRGFYAITTKPTNCPVTYASLIVTLSGSTVYQTILGVSTIHLRAYTGNPLAWTNWVQMPTRSEIDSAIKFSASLHSTDDLNNIIDSGVYGILGTDDTPSNIPTDYPVLWSNLIVLSASNGVKQQIITRPSAGRIFIRERSGNPATWSTWFCLPTRSEFNELYTKRNLVLNSTDTVLNIPDNTTTFTLFDNVIDSLGSLQGNTLEVQVGSSVVLGGVPISGGRKFCQILRYSTNAYAAITMFGWGSSNDRYYLVKSNGSWSCVRLPSRSEVDTLNTIVDVSSSASYDTTYIDSTSQNYLIKVQKIGKIVNLHVEFKAKVDIGTGAVIIATGLPPSAPNNASAQFVAYNVTKQKPTMLCVNTGGKLITYYGETISAGNTVRGDCMYFTT